MFLTSVDLLVEIMGFDRSDSYRIIRVEGLELYLFEEYVGGAFDKI